MVKTLGSCWGLVFGVLLGSNLWGHGRKQKKHFLVFPHQKKKYTQKPCIFFFLSGKVLGVFLFFFFLFFVGFFLFSLFLFHSRFLLGSCLWGLVGVGLWGRAGVVLGSCWGRAWVVLGSCWGRAGVVLGLLLGLLLGLGCCCFLGRFFAPWGFSRGACGLWFVGFFRRGCSPVLPLSAVCSVLPLFFLLSFFFCFLCFPRVLFCFLFLLLLLGVPCLFFCFRFFFCVCPSLLVVFLLLLVPFGFLVLFVCSILVLCSLFFSPLLFCFFPLVCSVATFCLFYSSFWFFLLLFTFSSSFAFY